MAPVQHAPRRKRQLHHRRKRAHLCRTDEILLIYLRVREEGPCRTSADHVGADERRADHSGGNHVRNKPVQVFPCRHLVAQPRQKRLSAKSESAFDLAAAILEREVDIEHVLVARCKRRVGGAKPLVAVKAGTVEFERIYPEFGHEAVEFADVPAAPFRGRQIDKSTPSVPPVNRRDASAVRLFDKAPSCRSYGRRRVWPGIQQSERR